MQNSSLGIFQPYVELPEPGTFVWISRSMLDRNLLSSNRYYEYPTQKFLAQ